MRREVPDMRKEQTTRLLRLLKPVRRRLFAIRFVRRTAVGLLAGSGAALLTLAAARIVPLPHAPAAAAACALAGLAAGAAAALRPRIDERKAARVMDRGGTDDAIVTALDALHLDTPAARLQRADAEAAAARYVSGLGERIPWPGGRGRKLYLAGLSAIWIAAAILLMLPNPMEERLAAKAALDEAIGRIERELKELESSDSLSEPDRRALTEPLKRLREQALRKDPEALRAEWKEAEREIGRLMAELGQKREALRSWAQELQRTPGLEAVGRALERGGRHSLADALEEAGGRFASLSPEQRNMLAERLRELASSAPDVLGDQLREALGRAAEAIGAGDPEAAADALREALEEALSAEALEALAEQAAAALASAGGRLGPGFGTGTGNGGWNGLADAEADGSSGSAGGPAGAEGSQGGSGSGGPEQGTEGGGSSRGPGGTGRSGSASGGASGSGTGGSSGAASGSGSAGAGSAEGSGGRGGFGTGAGSGTGSGAGSGTGTGGAGSGAGSGVGAGSGAGFGSGGRTLVTTPRIYAGEGEVTVDGGPASGGAVTEGGRSPVLDGGVRDYAEVYASYEAEARRALSDGTLPPALKERVKRYFEEIQPDR
ncbi:MAG: hypothetical protein A9Z00_14760 [Thermobacillus sp. ZCTH02-B1]|uniref:hypothetical protein n=1 Tax=Thermobacillus sp. ZCTH02-B1 TaxID=1858795 RepID=UPI000B568A43|nr:hypothetical protein [Thermobacillus sp. ZCTH02-B1]OUM95210.1 MAG: hypothetical protein A9Z00_14760 [Thermobacillus sp. ZCTH02-B1]